MAAVLTGMRKYTTYFGDAAAVATAFAGRPWAQALISAGALAGLTSVLLVFQLGQPRIFMAMARDGLLPPYFAKIHPRFRTPYRTTIWTGIAVGGVAMLTDIGSLADLTNIGTLFAFVLVCLGVIVLRRKDANRPRPFRVPLVPLFPLAALIEGAGTIGRGGSAILGPDGAYLAGPLYDEEGILYADLDPSRLWEERQRFDAAGHYHRPDVLRLTVTPR